jgi:hypothetical protein
MMSTWDARNMQRSVINTLKKCVKLVINKNCTEMHGQQNIKKKGKSELSAFDQV